MSAESGGQDWPSQIGMALASLRAPGRGAKELVKPINPAAFTEVTTCVEFIQLFILWYSRRFDHVGRGRELWRRVKPLKLLV